MKRSMYLNGIKRKFITHPIVALLGPRQCGKTTLAKMYAETVKTPVTLIDLEDPIDLARMENPKLTLEPLRGLIIIDEIQRAPALFQLLRVLADNPALDQSYLILGSASRELLRQSSESLAGRINYLELPPS